jgi:hypothetical protein
MNYGHPAGEILFLRSVYLPLASAPPRDIPLTLSLGYICGNLNRERYILET